jgi:hypothetical protein
MITATRLGSRAGAIVWNLVSRYYPPRKPVQELVEGRPRRGLDGLFSSLT